MGSLGLSSYRGRFGQLSAPVFRTSCPNDVFRRPAIQVCFTIHMCMYVCMYKCMYVFV